MSRGRARGRALACAAAALVLASACGQGGGTGGGGSEEPIKVGISLPLTGDFSQPGGAAKQGYEIWAEMVNEKGGVLGRKVKLDITDDASNQNTVVSDYNRLISRDDVDLLLGTFSSLLNLPASAVAEKNQMVFVCPACGSPDLFSRHFHYYFFAQPAPASHQADLFTKWVLSLPADKRPKTAAYPMQDDPFVRPVIEAIRDQLSKGGVKTVYQTVYPPDTSNFDTVASRIKAAKPDIVAQGAVFEDGVGLVRSLVKAGYSPKAFFQTSAPSEGGQYAKGIGEKNTEGMFYAVSWSPDTDYPLNKEFVQRYKQKFHGVPPEDAADAFAAAQVLQAAATGVGKIDQKAIADWLHSHTVKTILGPLSWDADGSPQQAFILAQWQDGKSEVVLPEDVATSKQIVFPKPDWAK